jgi:hypothetical protein
MLKKLPLTQKLDIMKGFGFHLRVHNRESTALKNLSFKPEVSQKHQKLCKTTRSYAKAPEVSQS